jgi:hypothetical protein
LLGIGQPLFHVSRSETAFLPKLIDAARQTFGEMVGQTLQNWEQGRRAPHGAARVLPQVAAKHPQAVWGVVKYLATTDAVNV